jgi:hypothetical protein
MCGVTVNQVFPADWKWHSLPAPVDDLNDIGRRGLGLD